MANPMTVLSTVNDLAKDYYSDVYVNYTNPETPLNKQFGSKLAGISYHGRKLLFKVKYGIGGGASNAGADTTLPDASQGSYDEGEATAVRTYTRLKIDNFAIEVTKTNQGAARAILKDTLEDRMQAHDLEVNRQRFCNGDGKLCAIVTGGANSATQTLEKDYGVVNGGPGTRHVYPGDGVAVRKSDGTLLGRRKVVSVDHDAGTTVLDSAIDTTVAEVGGIEHFITKGTDDTDNYTAGEGLGLLQAVTDSGTFETIPVTSGWKALRLHNSAVIRKLTNAVVMQAIETARARSRMTPNLAVAPPGVILRYSETFLPLQQINGQDIELKGGYKPVKMILHGSGVIPVIGDADCPNYRMFLLHTSAFRSIDLLGTEVAEPDGIRFTRVTDQDAVEGYVRKYWQQLCVQRNANVVIEDIEDSVITKAA